MNTYRFISFFVATEHGYITIDVINLLLSDNYLASTFSPSQTSLRGIACSNILVYSGDFFPGRESPRSEIFGSKSKPFCPVTF